MTDRPPDSKILSVLQLTRTIKDQLESRFPEVWIRGEISNFRQQASGHCYFSIKDRDAQITTVIFRREASRVPFSIQNGVEVIAGGRLTVYEPRGNYQLILHSLLEDGVGRLQAEFERLRKKLEAEGLFERDRKKPIPRMPKRVGVITSPTGAALQDFLRILHRRNWRGEVLIFPTRVQGTEAANEITAAIECANREQLCDLLVLTRGGGSIEDLWPFNEEIVARAVAASTIPTISAVGHEIDFTLSDFASDQRAETPSGAAETISSTWLVLRDRWNQAQKQFARNLLDQERSNRQKLQLITARLQKYHPRLRLDNAAMRLDDLAQRLPNALEIKINRSRDRLQFLEHRFSQSPPEKEIKAQRDYLDTLTRRLRQASPESALLRGYAYISDGKGKVLSRKSMLKKNSSITLHQADGETEAAVQ